MYERRSDGATIRFTPTGPGLYEIHLQGHPGASGLEIKKAMNDAIGWMFVHTDAYVLKGYIAPDNKRCLAMCPHWIARLERHTDHCVLNATLAHWAKAYGIERALSEMRAAGQSVKADKLEAAANAAGAL